jgi:coproporphyrinogen III oxidase
MREWARALVESLQDRFRSRLEAASGETLTRVRWQRDGGRHGGGARDCTAETPAFNRAAINVSQVHYDDLADRGLDSATALSTIIHPQNALAPSVHIHLSWTELRTGHGTWRLMADLNPATPVDTDTATFVSALRAAAPTEFEAARAQGDRYFNIPALGRTRGVAHFYLESYATADPEADRALAARFGEVAIDTYSSLFEASRVRVPDAAAQAAQLAYHTLYLFQVLTLDRGTTSGLRVHDQNDVGILGSLPSRIDRALLASWTERVEPLQRPLVERLVDTIPPSGEVDDPTRAALARAVRTFYEAHPEALALQASGGIIPPTVQQHRG